jgi:hypothetical protein
MEIRTPFTTWRKGDSGKRDARAGEMNFNWLPAAARRHQP